jgi:hypothetical protein
MKVKMKILSSILLLLGVVLAGVFFLYLPRIMIRYPAASESYAMHMFPWISRPIAYLSSLVPVSLTEILVLFMAGSILLWLTWLIVRIVHSDHRQKLMFRAVLILCVVFFVSSASFTLMHGINYTRIPLEKSLQLDRKDWSEEELIEVTKWMQKQMNDTRSELSEDEDGRMILSTTIIQALSDGYKGMDRAAAEFPELSGSTVRAKPVALSHYWSYTGITGMYFPFLGEANVNVDIPACGLPMTISHEISHTRGIAREQDANLAAFLACIYSERKDFQYSGYEFAFTYCLSDLKSANIDAYQSVLSEISDAVYRDWLQENEYWAQFEGPVQETSTQINDSYLKANQQEDGVRSYSLVTNLIIDYYFTYVKGT